MQLQPVIANKNYSSWSMRPWITLCQSAIDFDDVQLKFGDEPRVRDIAAYGSPGGQLPLLLIDGTAVWDSRAICETLAEIPPEKNLWPADVPARRLGRAEMAFVPADESMRRRCNRAARA